MKLLATVRQPEKHFDIPEKGLFLVGFGKAVLGIAAHLVSLLEKRVLKGVLSVPVGTKETGPREQHQVELWSEGDGGSGGKHPGREC